MSFLHAHYLWFLSALAFPLIMRLRKKKYQKFPVPHLHFWLRENETLKRNKWKVDIRDLLYLLPLFLLFFLTNLSLTEPYNGNLHKTSHYLVVVDISPSMKTTTRSQSRLQTVQDLLQKMSLSNYTIFTTHKIPQVISLEDISKLEVGESDIENALEFVQNFYQANDHIIVFSDGVNSAWTKALAKLREKVGDKLLVQTIGDYSANSGIYVKKIEYTNVYIQIYHDYSISTSTRLLWRRLDTSTPQKYYQKKIQLLPQKNLVEKLTLLPGKWEFRLDLDENLQQDNIITQVVAKQKKCRVLVLSDKKIPEFMAALGVYQNLIDHNNSAFEVQTVPDKFFDLVFVHLPQWDFSAKANYSKVVLWNSKGNFLPYTAFRVEKKSNFRNIFHHKLMQNIDFSLLTTTAINLYTHSKNNLVVHPNGSAIWQSSYQNTPFIYIGFSLQDSNITFLPSFPIFIKNLLLWATPPTPQVTPAPKTPITLKATIRHDKPLAVIEQNKVIYLQWYVILGAYALGIVCITYFWKN